MNLRIPVIDADNPQPIIPETVNRGRWMQLCNETITVFNAKLNSETGYDEYHGSVIEGVSWFCEIVSTVDQGLKAANKFTIRIPQYADFGGKTYVSPLDYANAEDVSDIFTLKNGDILVRGAVTGSNHKPSDLHKFHEAFTVLGVTDNRRAPKAPHWKVIGA